MTRIVLITVSSFLFFGLAVLGWGGFAAFFAHSAFIALTIAIAAMFVVALFAGGNLSPGVREDRTNRWVLLAFTLIGFALSYLPAYADRKSFLTVDGETIRWIGVVLFSLGGVLRIWPVFVLGQRFSGLVAIQEGHRLVTKGIYGVIRHPSYLGVVVMTLGWALAFRALIGVLLALAIVPVLIARIDAEEALLCSQFGAEYDAYRARTSRLIPGIY